MSNRMVVVVLGLALMAGCDEHTAADIDAQLHARCVQVFRVAHTNVDSLDLLKSREWSYCARYLTP